MANSNIDEAVPASDEDQNYDLEQREFAENDLTKASPLAYRALVISEKGYAPSPKGGLKILDSEQDVNLSVDVSSTEEMNFKQTGAAMLVAVVQSSVPYTIARTQGHITVIFGYNSDSVPTIELTGNLRNCDYYYANPENDTVTNQDGEVEDVKAQTGGKGSLPLSILTHLAAVAAGYAMNQNGPGEEKNASY